MDKSKINLSKEKDQRKLNNGKTKSNSKKILGFPRSINVVTKVTISGFPTSINFENTTLNFDGDGKLVSTTYAAPTSIKLAFQ